MPVREVVIVGAGPAGAATAIHLARAGRDVLLLDRRQFPRDKSCGDALTGSAVRCLEELDVLESLASPQRVRRLRVTLRSGRTRDFAFPTLDGSDHGPIVVPRRVLDAAICAKAAAVGATVWQDAVALGLIQHQGRVRGVHVQRRGERFAVRAEVVVAADGATSALARQAGLITTPRSRTGFAVRTYYRDVADLDESLEFFLPLADSTGEHILPSYGWIFPIGPDAANVGVGVSERVNALNVRELFSRFLQELALRDPRFDHAVADADWRGAPLRFDFSPDRCSAAGLLVVGDAAGLVSPFTGEGIGYALESAKAAAEAIDRRFKSDALTFNRWDDYVSELGSRFAGYFETGREAVHRFRLTWQLLASTFDSDAPLFALARRTVLLPEAVGDLYAPEVVEDIAPLLPEEPSLRQRMLSVNEALIDCLRPDWPFFARLLMNRSRDGVIAVSPAILALLAAEYGDPKDPRVISLAAALELGFIAGLAGLSVAEEGLQRTTYQRKNANWGNRFAIMVGNLLLSRAAWLSSVDAEHLAVPLTAAVASMCEARIRELRAMDQGLTDAEQQIELIAETRARLFTVACGLAGGVSGASSADVGALRRYGQDLGIAYVLTEDIRQFRRQTEESPRSLFRRDCPSSLPLFLLRANGLPVMHRGLDEDADLGRRSDRELRARLIHLDRRAGATRKTAEHAERHMKSAARALQELPEDPVRQSLERIAQFATQRLGGKQQPR